MATNLGKILSEVAYSYVRPDDLCYEEVSNKGNCINDLKCRFHGIVDSCSSENLQNEAYCAIGLYEIVREGLIEAKVSDEVLSLWKQIKTAGAKDMLNRARNSNLRVSRTPTIGSCGYRISKAQGSTGHVFIVTNVNEEVGGERVFRTVEANMSFVHNGQKYEGIWSRTYRYIDIEKLGMYFWHTDELPAPNISSPTEIANNLLKGISLIVGVVGVYKGFKALT